MPYTEDYPESETEAESPDILGEAETSPETEETEAKTTLIPKSLLGEKVKPGDKLSIEVVKLYEDDAEIKVSESEPEESDGMEEAYGEMEKLGKPMMES